MYVTCFYDIYNRPDKIEEHIKLFQPLADSGLNIHLYTSPECSHHFKNYPKNIKILEIPLNMLELYNLGINSDASLPIERNLNKDTREYISLMNTKIEFLLRSSEICEDKNLIWIDFGIFKLFNNHSQCIEYLKEYADYDFDKVNIPGCWYNNEALYLNMITWRFCGSFFVVPRNYISRFFNDSRETFSKFITTDGHILTWEVNVWNHIEFYKGKDYIKWYYALHNDTMLSTLIENIDPWTGQKI
jgi:hypothetical protein